MMFKYKVLTTALMLNIMIDCIQGILYCCGGDYCYKDKHFNEFGIEDKCSLLVVENQVSFSFELKSYFNYYSYIEKVIAVNANISVLKPGTIVNVIAVKEVHLAYNNIGYWPNDAFIGVNFVFLDLSWNEILYIEDGAVDKLSELKYLNLSHNKLLEFSSKLSNVSPVELILSYNDLTSFTLTEDSTRINFLDLSFNKIESISARSLSLSKLDVTMNELADLTRIYVKSVRELYVPFNNITVRSNSIFKTLRQISIEANPWYCSELYLLYADINFFKMKYVHSNSDARISGLTDTFPVCIDKNDLSTRSLFRMAAKKLISYNPVSCSCNRDCPDNQMCKNHQCWDLCQNNICHEPAICVAKNHQFQCKCLDTYKLNPHEGNKNCSEGDLPCRTSNCYAIQWYTPVVRHRNLTKL